MMLYEISDLIEIETPSDGTEDRVRARLVEAAETFLRAGGVLDLSTWRALSSDERLAFAAAGDRVRAMSALRIARACSGPEGVLDVAGEIAGEDLRRRALTLAAMDAAAREARKMLAQEEAA